MANFKITATTTVAELKEQFHNEFGGILRVYQGRSEAPEDATLVSLGGKVGELECRASRTVGKFIEAFQSELGLKVKVYTKDNWVSVLDGITLATVREIPKNARKAQMEQFLAYQRDEKEDDTTTGKSSQVPDEYKNILLIDIDFIRIELPEDEDSYEDVGEEMAKKFGNNGNGIAVLFHGVPDGDQAAIVISEDDRSYESLMQEANNLISHLPKEEDSQLYLSSNIDIYNEDFYYCDAIIGVALNEFCDGGNKHEYSYEWEEGDMNGKAILRVNFGNNSAIFIAYDNGDIEMLGLSDEQFDYLTRLSTLEYCDDTTTSNVGAIYEYGRKGKVGFINSQAQITIEPQFSEVSELKGSDYCFAVKKDGLWGAIKNDGSYIFEPQFGVLHNTYPITIIEKDGKWGFADVSKGKILIAPMFDRIKEHLGEEYYNVLLDGKWGIMNSKLEYVVPPTFPDMGYFSHGYAAAQSPDNELYGIINVNGEFILKPQYYQISYISMQNDELVIFTKTEDNEKIKVDINGNPID